MTSTGHIDFSRKPTADMEPEFYAYWYAAEGGRLQPWILVFVEQLVVNASNQVYAVFEFEGKPVYARIDELRMPKLVCAECGEPAQEQPPTSMGLASLRSAKPHRYSHLDGEPLCPVMGADGYEPCGVV